MVRKGKQHFQCVWLKKGRFLWLLFFSLIHVLLFYFFLSSHHFFSSALHRSSCCSPSVVSYLKFLGSVFPQTAILQRNWSFTKCASDLHLYFIVLNRSKRIERILIKLHVARKEIDFFLFFSLNGRWLQRQYGVTLENAIQIGLCSRWMRVI